MNDAANTIRCLLEVAIVEETSIRIVVDELPTIRNCNDAAASIGLGPRDYGTGASKESIEIVGDNWDLTIHR